MVRMKLDRPRPLAIKIAEPGQSETERRVGSNINPARPQSLEPPGADPHAR